MSDDTRAIEAAIASLKAQFVERFGTTRGVPCVSATCLLIATRRVFWPGTLAGEEFPVYCDACAARARVVTEALGARYHDEPLPVPEDLRPSRAVSTEGRIE